MKKNELAEIMKKHGAVSLTVRPFYGDAYRVYLIESKTPIDALGNLVGRPGPCMVNLRYDCYDGDWYTYRVTPPEAWVADLEKFSAGLVSC